MFSLLLLLGLIVAVAAKAAPRNYTYYDYGQMETKIRELEKEFPNLIKVTTAQDEYGLPSPGKCGSSGDCKQYIVHLTNFETYDTEKATRPEVFFSGCLHGDERVGTTTLVEFMQLMAQAHTSNSNAWLKRLVDTRSIFIMPAANALGYFRNEREENGIDPNRDFAFDLEDETQCMKSITARSLNELFREHMFQLAITFHSGTRMLGYEWGDVTHQADYFSPDDYSQATIGSALSAFAGKFAAPSPLSQGSVGGFPPDPSLYDRLTYPNGPITPLVYPVRGGMEDWGYAASWAENSNVCRPSTFGGYPVEKTQYSDSMLRVFNMLVESDDDKSPPESSLGNDAHLLKPTGEAQGHIPRHIRLVLTMTEAVQPYFKFVSAISPVSVGTCGALDLEADIDESMITRDDVNGKINILRSNPRGVVSLSYEIGGGFTVNSTKIKLFKRPPDFDVHKITFSAEDLEELHLIGETAEQSGYTRWGGGGGFRSAESSNYQGFLDAYAEINLTSTDNIDDREQYPFIPAWKACFRTPTDVGEYLIFASATMDQNWAEIPDIAVPANVPLQAHVSQARTNSSWMMSNAGFEIKGQVEWLSRPILMQVTDKVAPTGWSCNPLYYGAHDGCDCNCGIRDPDCSDEGARVYNCEDEQVCLEAQCVFPNSTNATSSPTIEPTPAPTSLPESWTCDPKFFDALDGCDCNCGAKDPDCDVINADVYNCASDEVCVEDKCVDAGSPTPAPIASPTKPPVTGWTCDILYYNASDGCDCSCGVPDPDCEDTSLAVYNCITGDVCVDGECVAESLPTLDPTQNPTPASSIPEGWTCYPDFYNASDGCDCGCGVQDLDCEDSSTVVFNCSPGQTCVDGQCFGEIVNQTENPTAAPIFVEGWTCDFDHYNASDGCDCQCGVPDPDCEDTSAEVFNCITGDTCVDGECFGEPMPTSAPVQSPTPASVIPEGWTCKSAFYGASDGCDCNCGVQDPDCEDSDAKVYNCDKGEICFDAVCYAEHDDSSFSELLEEALCNVLASLFGLSC